MIPAVDVAYGRGGRKKGGQGSVGVQKEPLIFDSRQKYGFDILSIEQNHIFPYQIEPYKQGQYIKEPWFESMPDKMFNTLKKKLGWHLLITARC